MTIDPEAPPCLRVISTELGEFVITDMLPCLATIPPISFTSAVVDEAFGLLHPQLDLAAAALLESMPVSTPLASTPHQSVQLMAL